MNNKEKQWRLEKAIYSILHCHLFQLVHITFYLDKKIFILNLIHQDFKSRQEKNRGNIKSPNNIN